MDQAQFQHLKILVTATSAGQTLELEDVIQDIIDRKIVEIALARRTRQTCGVRTCPHCRSNDVVLNGNDQNGRQRFKCRDCGRSYNILTGTPMARAKKVEKWAQYLECMTEHMPLRQIVASGIGVNLVTAWRWRHRFLLAAANDNAAVLSGLVEAGTTSFPRSFKGSRGLNNGKPGGSRDRRSRTGGIEAAEVDHEQVPVLTALDSGGGVFEAILVSLTEIETVLDGRIRPGSVLCSSESACYVNVAKKADAEHYAVSVDASVRHAAQIRPALLAKSKSGCLALRRLTNHHQRLKYLINDRCRGVATKYLTKYLGWHRAMSRPEFQGDMLLDWALL